MITPLTIYIIGIMDNISHFFFFLGALFVAIGISCGVFFIVSKEEYEGNLFGRGLRWAKRLLLAGFICILTNMFIPSSKTAAAMFLLPAIANNENIQAIGDNSIKILRALTEQWMMELNGVSSGGKADAVH